MLIVFARPEQRRCVVHVHRRDGVVVELSGLSTHRVPHDLAHFVTERELLLSGGVYGNLAAGAVFASARIVAGRPRPDAGPRSQRILATNRRALATAETLSGFMHSIVEHHRPDPPLAQVQENWGIIEEGPCPWTSADVARTLRILREADQRWQRLAAESTMEEFWPDVLTSPVPRPPARGRS